METFPIEVKTYISPSGKDVFHHWLSNLRDLQARDVIRTRIDRLRMGLIGVYKHVGHGVLELKIYSGPGYRVYFSWDRKNIVILICGGDKSTQSHDIWMAHKYWANYRSRKNA